MRSNWTTIVIVLSFTVLILLAAAPSQAQNFSQFVRFAHPQDGDVIAPGQEIEVVAVAVGSTPPADLQLEYLECVGTSCAFPWQSVSDPALRGRAIHGVYIPVNQASTIVHFRTNSATAWANSFVTVLVE